MSANPFRKYIINVLNSYRSYGWGHEVLYKVENEDEPIDLESLTDEELLALCEQCLIEDRLW